MKLGKFFNKKSVLDENTQNTEKVKDDEKIIFPYGATERGFHGKNIFFDTSKISPNSKIIFDVGAWQGDTIKEFFEFFPDAKIYCFEPTPTIFTDLEKKFESDKRVQVFQIAISDKIGETDLYLYSQTPSNSLLRWIDNEETNKIKVKTTTLDNFCTFQGINRINILKMDIQGAETSLLKGAQNLLKHKRIDLILTEVLFVNLYDGQGDYFDIAKMLSDYEYYLYDFYNFAYEENGQVKFGDAIFLPRKN